MNKVVLSGKLGFLGLGDVLQLIGSNGGTGELRIISKFHPDPGIIYMVKGNIVHASAMSFSGIDAAYALFGWVEGEYEFHEGEVNTQRTISTNRMEIILDGLRKVDDGEVEKLGPVSFERHEKDEEKRIPVIRGQIVDYMYVAAEESYSKGQVIFEENSHGSWIWTVLEGVVEVVKETPTGPFHILRLGSGAFIGSMGTFSFQDNIRSASIVAVTDVQLGVMDSQRLAEEFSHQSKEFREFLLSLDKRRRIVTDSVVEIFSRKNNFKKLIKNMKPVIRQGKKEKNLYQIKQGEAVIIRKEKKAFLPLGKLGKGDFIGRIPFLDIGHEPHSATIFASKGFEAVRVDVHKIQEEYDQLSPSFRNIVDNIGTSISITTRVACDIKTRNKGK